MHCKFVLTLVTGLLECMCFAGVTFGWASLVFVLKKENYFQDLCPNAANHTANSTDSCLPQDERFSLIFTVAAFMNNLMTLPAGYIFDRFGTMAARFIGIFFYTSATLCIALSTADTGMLLFPALSLLSTGGIIFILTNMQVGNLFGAQRSTIITLYNGAFDSSSVIFLIVKVLYQNGISLRTLFLFFSCCSVIHILRTIFLLPKGHIPYPLPVGYNYGVSCVKDNAKKTESMDSSASPNEGEKYQDATGLAAEPFLNNTIKQDEQPEVSFWRCAFSSLFGWHLIWLSLMQLRHYLFIGTLNPTITHLSGGDLHTVSKYTNVFAVSQFCGVLCAPWNGLIMDRHKRKNKDTGKHDDLHSSILSLTLTAIQCILFSLCASIPLLPALYPTFILQVLNRSFLYGGNAAFLSIAFPAKHFGKLYGLVMSLSAVISLLQYPAFYIIRTHLHGDPLYVNIFLAILMLVTFAHPMNVFRVYRKEARKAIDSHVS
ncbi:equilibrative nucleobase transporter 1 isoform 1-T3 [Mantella aurantiaca]